LKIQTTKTEKKEEEEEKYGGFPRPVGDFVQGQLE
jgi:hypothetical protein